MKNKFLLFGLAISLMGAVACSEKKEAVMTQDPNTAVDAVDSTANLPVTGEDTSAIEDAPATETEITVTGKVTEINRGKDGYTATIEAADGKVYKGTISIPNMGDPKKYRNVNIGETITVIGTTFGPGDDTIIKVTDLK
jgi:hypothetical protein